MKSNFKKNDKVIYPTHGVGLISGEEVQSIGDVEIKMFVISFVKDKMVLRVPVHRATECGLRALSNQNELEKAMTILRSRPKVGSKMMWSKKQQDLATKINSGNIIHIAEVVRDLFKNSKDDRSFSERTIFESALHRLASEYAAVKNISNEDAVSLLIDTIEQKEVA